MFFSVSCMHSCCNAGNNAKYHTKCGMPKLLPCTKIRGTRATVIIIGENLSFPWWVKIFTRVLLKRLQRLTDRSCQRHSLDLGLVDQWLVLSLHCASCRKNAGNEENHYSSPLLIWQRPLILWAWNLWEKSVVHLSFCSYSFLFTRTWMCAFSSMEIHKGLSRWGMVLNRVVSWHPLSMPFTLLPSFNMPLMGTRMEFTSEPDSKDVFLIWKDWSWNDWWLKCWLENCSLLMMLQ